MDFDESVETVVKELGLPQFRVLYLDQIAGGVKGKKRSWLRLQGN